MLYVKDAPALCYSLVFATSSSILEAQVTGYGDFMKLVHINPIVYEYERLLGVIAHLSGGRVTVKYYGPGLRCSTRGRKENWKGFGSNALSPKGILSPF